MEIFIIFLLILLNGVFSMSEIALVSAKKPRLEADSRKGSKRAKTAFHLTKTPDIFLSTVQIGITLIGIMTGIYSGNNITDDLEFVLSSVVILVPYAGGLAVGLVVVAITFFTLVLGELVPKRIGLSNPEKYAKLLAGPMTLISKVTAPFVWLLIKASGLVLKLFNIKQAEVQVTEEEIRAMVEEGARGGIVQAVEQDIVERVFHLGDRRISSLMVYRTEVISIPLEAEVSQIRNILSDSLYSVYPVVENNLDNVVGVVYLKDLFRHLTEENFRIKDYIKPASYIAETTSAYKTLEIFKRTGVHYSLVTDEYGTIMGIVTMNDILEALLGDGVENGREEPGIQQREDGSWLVDGDFPFHEFLHHFNLAIGVHSYHFDTLGGLILSELGYIPKAGEKILWSGYELEVVDMDRVKIDKVLVIHLKEDFTD